MALLETHFYGSLENINNLKSDLDHCEDEKKSEVKDLLECAGFDYEGYQRNPNTIDIDIKNWQFKNDSKIFTENRTVKVTFQTDNNWDHRDYKPLLLISKLYGVNYRSCTKSSPLTKSSNVSFEDKDYEILQIRNPYINKTYESVIFGTKQRRKEVIKNILHRQKGKASHTTKKLTDCSNQLISGVYYDSEV